MWDSSRIVNLAALAIATLALVAFAAGAAVWASRRPMFALKSIRLEPFVSSAASVQPNGTFRHVDASTVRDAALPTIRASTTGNFFTVDLEAVRKAFETVPWVRRAQVRREWPDRLVVRLEEHQVLGTWDDGRLVNTFGELFVAKAADARQDAEALPELAGPDGSERDVASRFVDFRTWFARLALVPDQVTLSPRYAWSVHFDNGTENGLTVDLGRERDGNTVPERVLRMLAAWPQLVARWPKPTLIDLRYPNGFALRADGLRLAEETSKPGLVTPRSASKPIAKTTAKTRPPANEGKNKP